jgi:DNA repair exonuclease SbcCD ATPase subunit
MRYISRIILENFQSYKYEEIDLKPGLNIILGSSDSGKSAILRAISFVLYNYPKNNTLIHQGTSEVKVTLEFSDGVSVTRIKDELGDKNAYVVSTADGKTITYDKVDKAIPEEVKKVLNNPPEDELNGFISYADQFSKMFLVDLSPTDLPRSLSILTGIEILEESAKELMSSYKSLEKQTRTEQNNYVKLLNELNSYSYIEEYSDKLENVTKKLKELNKLEKELSELSKYSFSGSLTTNDNDLMALNNGILVLDDLLNKIKKAHATINEYDKLQIFNLVSKTKYIQQDIIFLENVLVSIKSSFDNIKLTQSQIEEYTALCDIQNKITKIKNNGEKFTQEYKLLKSESEKTEKELEDYKQMLIDKGIRCETCGSILQ